MQKSNFLNKLPTVEWPGLDLYWVDFGLKSDWTINIIVLYLMLILAHLATYVNELKYKSTM